MFVPAVINGRLRTMLDAVFQRRKLLRDRADAWEKYKQSQNGVKANMKLAPGDRVARFVRNIQGANLPHPTRYLELGSFQGASLAFVHTLLHGQMKATCIDPFDSHPELPETDWGQIEQQFHANVAAIKADVRALKGRTIDHLPALIEAGEQFDLIYIDGSHRTLDVMLDAVLAWQLLTPNGLMIFDDYWYDIFETGERYRPKSAIDAFIGMMGHEVEVIDIAGQAFMRKIAYAPQGVATAHLGFRTNVADRQPA